MRDAGFPVADRQEAIDASWEKFWDFYASPAARAAPGPAARPDWELAASFERAAAVADATCRSGAHRRLVTELAPAGARIGGWPR